MIHRDASFRMRLRRAALLLTIATLPLIVGPAVEAQSIMRSPNLNIGARVPSMTAVAPPPVAVVTPRINPNVAGTAVTGVDRTNPNLRTVPGCSAADRDSDGGCFGQPVASGRGGGGNSNRGSGSRHNQALAAVDPHIAANELVAEIDGSLSDAQADQLARRHGLTRLQSQNFPLVGATIGLFRITGRRSIEAARRDLASDTGVRSVQPNFRYLLQDQAAALSEGDPAQYALGKLRLPEAHGLAHGVNVTIAVIDSGIDVKHPEFVGSIADSFDALGSKEGPHLHGTAVAGAIVAHARLMSGAPAARILAIRAFGTAANGAESTSYVILKGLDYAAGRGAQIVNMSFAGPKDALIERAIAAAAAKGMVLVAAAGNAGAKSPPLYPAANGNVIAVSATDAQDKLFAASNRGSYIAVAAPGADIFLPAPDGKYQMTSGTSFSAAYISGIAALLLERNPALKPEELRAILMKTARDLGSPGRDDQFGAGEADAFAAVSAIVPKPALPPASDRPAGEAVSDRQQAPATRSLDQSGPAMASDKTAVGEASRAAAQ